MEYAVGKYSIEERDAINEWAQAHREYDINEYTTHIEIVKRTAEQIKATDIQDLKAELTKIKEDIEQENFGLVRNDYNEKKARAAEIINRLRVLEGKEPREILL